MIREYGEKGCLSVLISVIIWMGAGCFSFAGNAAELLHADAFGHPLTLLGSDTNHNLIRDDLDHWLDRRIDLSSKQRIVLERMIRTIQSTLIVNLEDKKSVRDVALQVESEKSCMYDYFLPPEVAESFLRQLEALVVNNRDRIFQYRAYNYVRLQLSPPLSVFPPCSLR